ncbi:MAG: hypothetical protein V7K55_10790 [Nostoc sp.]|uniref:hypothetical protein n=1 Tax=Nostoc sp. TaxID=1180 RepID=UPI002FFA650A
MVAFQPDTAEPRKIRSCKSVWRRYQWGCILKKLGFAAVDLGGFVSSSGKISTYQ